MRALRRLESTSATEPAIPAGAVAASETAPAAAATSTEPDGAGSSSPHPGRRLTGRAHRCPGSRFRSCWSEGQTKTSGWRRRRRPSAGRSRSGCGSSGLQDSSPACLPPTLTAPAQPSGSDKARHPCSPIWSPRDHAPAREAHPAVSHRASSTPAPSGASSSVAPSSNLTAAPPPSTNPLPQAPSNAGNTGGGGAPGAPSTGTPPPAPRPETTRHATKPKQTAGTGTVSGGG